MKAYEQPPELDDEDEAILDAIWANLDAPQVTKAVKVYSPTTDPDSVIKIQTARSIEHAVGLYFDGLAKRLITGIGRVGAAKAIDRRLGSYFDDQFWSDELDSMDRMLSPIVESTVAKVGTDTAKVLRAQTGIGFDGAILDNHAADYAQQYTDGVLKSLNTTTQDGIGKIIAQYLQDPEATVDDLVAAIQESRLVSPDRARIVGITESTRAVGAGQYIAGQELADSAQVDVAVDMSTFGDLLPAHPYCRCSAMAYFTYDDAGHITGMDYLWFYVQDAHQECPICAPRNGRYFSEIASAA